MRATSGLLRIATHGLKEATGPTAVRMLSGKLRSVDHRHIDCSLSTAVFAIST
jgi:hypothetical protein